MLLGFQEQDRWCTATRMTPASKPSTTLVACQPTQSPATLTPGPGSCPLHAEGGCSAVLVGCTKRLLAVALHHLSCSRLHHLSCSRLRPPVHTVFCALLFTLPWHLFPLPPCSPHLEG